MKKNITLSGLFYVICIAAISQTNMTVSNPEALQILMGNYNPALYTPSVVINNTDSILNGMVNRVSIDSMFSWLKHIDGYYNRNTGSDTISNTKGIGAVRRWIYQKYNGFRAASENRLVVSYLDFDYPVCGKTHHKNVFALLPGLDTTQKEILVVEGHFDTRCVGVCDTLCYSPGMEDNGSGTVLVMELARTLSKYAFDHTILFSNNTGEDQGLYGARALANWMHQQNLKIRVVFNNDVIGGIICGMTSSPPSCPGFNNIDSTHVRIFSFSPGNDSSTVSAHKQLARYIRMHQVERINPLLATPMNINIIIYEDRINRSGDHIPFRQNGYTAIRFCAQNEHGNGQGIPPDRQHTSDDILGVDTSVPPDGVIDSFFVDKSYLRRNTIMNGVNLGWLANAPPKPTPEFIPATGGIEIILHGADSVYQHYRVGVRTRGSGTLYFDTLYTFLNTNHIILTGLDPTKEHFYSVANVRNNIESLFCNEYADYATGINSRVRQDWGLVMKQNTPNPFHGQTEIVIESENTVAKDASLLITDMAGRMVQSISLEINPGENRIVIKNSANWSGVYTCTLTIGGRSVCSLKMGIY